MQQEIFLQPENFSKEIRVRIKIKYYARITQDRLLINEENFDGQLRTFLGLALKQYRSVPLKLICEWQPKNSLPDELERTYQTNIFENKRCKYSKEQIIQVSTGSPSKPP